MLQEQVQQARLDVLERRRQRGRDIARDEVGAAGVLRWLAPAIVSLLFAVSWNTCFYGGWDVRRGE